MKVKYIFIIVSMFAIAVNAQYYNNREERIVTKERPSWQGGGIETRSSAGWSAVTKERPTWQGGGTETRFNDGTTVIQKERPTWQGGGTETTIRYGR